MNATLNLKLLLSGFAFEPAASVSPDVRPEPRRVSSTLGA
jgi:hypothetical protein